MKKVLFGLLMLVSFGVLAADVTYTAGSVKDRVSTARGGVVQIAVKDESFQYTLQSLNIGGNRTTAQVAYLLSAGGFHGGAGLGGVSETGVKSHAVYFGTVGYGYDFGNKISASADLGYKNDFQRNILNREVTIGAGVNYALLPKTSLGLGFVRYNGDAKLNVLALNVNSKF